MGKEPRVKYLGLMTFMSLWLAGLFLPAAAEPLKEGPVSPPASPSVGASKPNAGELITEPFLPVVVPSPPKITEGSPSNANPPAARPQNAPKKDETAPALKHLAASGAKLTELGTSHGMRGILAQRGEEFMLFQVAPDGEAVISGLQAELSVANLLSLLGSQVTELSAAHGLRGFFVRDGAQFQVFYATPDGERLIPGVMWDAMGKNITHEHVAQIPGVVPTVEFGNQPAGASTEQGSEQKPALDLVRKTSFGLIGSDQAPRLWMFVDPLCSFSVRALQDVKGFAASKQVQVAVIPVSVLDYQTQGQSTLAALALLSKPASDLVESWDHQNFKGPASAEASARLEGNMAVATAIHLRGTPTLIWRKADGSEGRSDGVPNWTDVLASLKGQANGE